MRSPKWCNKNKKGGMEITKIERNSNNYILKIKPFKVLLELMNTARSQAIISMYKV